MLPASLYFSLYSHTMLLVVIGCALLYWSGQAQPGNLAHFNQVAMIVIGFGLALFIGFRPISGVFVDMWGYAREYESVQQGHAGSSNDVIFNVLTRLCAPILPTKGFFFVCALIYIVPLAVASWRVHGVWAFPVFLAFLTAFSFWSYGTNGIRNGMALSVLILAFAFDDKPIIMIALMAAAGGIHASITLPAGAFLVVRYFKKTRVWLIFWAVCAVTTFVAGSAGDRLLSRYNPFAGETRLDGYIAGSSGGFRLDFITYSIVPVLATLLLAAPTRARARHALARVANSPGMNWLRNPNAVRAKGVGIGMLARGGAFRAVTTPASAAGVSSVVCYGETPPELAAGTAAVTRVAGRSPRTGLAGARNTSRGQARSMPRAGWRQSGWDNLPWVQFLRADPFYARLVNTYLLANAVWLLVIHATCGNRFAYLSWFMMPWVLLYPFVPGKLNDRPRIGLIATVLVAQYSFTYIMGVIIYPLRGML